MPRKGDAKSARYVMDRGTGGKGMKAVPIETSGRILVGAKLLLTIIGIVGVALAASYGGSFAQSPQDDSSIARRYTSASPAPTPVAIPSLVMEGTGQIAPSLAPCNAKSCPGMFTAKLSGWPFGKADLALNLAVNLTADPLHRMQSGDRYRRNQQ